ncbi:MAG TPA: acyl-CoA desaturase [Kribbellaceae bacterium]|jgi:fatty acid desaturase
MSVAERNLLSARELSGYAELAGEIRRMGLLRRRPGFYACLMIANLLALAAVVTAMVFLRESWWLMLLAVAFAVVSAQIGFYSHDAGHRQIARRSGPSNLLGLLHANVLSGLSFGWWVGKHNAHHAHPNDLDGDPDAQPGVLVFDAGSAMSRRGAAAWLTRHQAWLFFPLLLLEAVSLQVASVSAVTRPGIRRRGAEAALLAVHFAAYAALLVTTMTWAQVAVFVVIHQGLLGVYLGCAFAPNHKGMPALPADQARDPLLRQVLTSRNIRGGVATDLVLGGLNYQIEHHLFPSMPRPNLRRAQPVVRRFCERHGVPYEESSALTSYGTVLRHLHDVGAGLRHMRSQTG